MDHLPLPLIVAVLGLVSSGLGQTYTTQFGEPGNPLSEKGRWSQAGVDWTGIRVTNGVAFGTQTGTNSGSARYDDSYAHLTGFPPDQEAWGRAYIAYPNPVCHQELEVLLRWNSAPHRTTGYECFARCVTGESAYVQIVRWDGPLGKFTYLADKRGPQYGLKHGDVLKASIVGNVITVFINGVEKARVTDDTFKTGNPGIGEFLACDHGNGVGSNADFGFSSFTARGIGGPLECFGASDLDRVFEDGYGSPGSWPTTLDAFGLRGGTVSAQCVLLAHQDLEGLTISLGPLRQTNGAGVIAPEHLRWNFVGSIFIDQNSPNRQPPNRLRPAPAWFPDVLTEDRQGSLTNGGRKAVYITLNIPPGTAPGEYRATVTASAGSVSAAIPLSLRVYPLDLPEQRHLFVTEWFTTSGFKRYHGVDPSDGEGFFRLLKIYARNMAEHRQNVFRVGLGLIQARRGAEGKLGFDFSRFDALAQVFWDTGKMDLLETGFIARFGEDGWSSREIVLDHFPVADADGRRAAMAGEEFLPQFLPAFVAHLRAKGWLEKTVFHIADEPSDHNVMAWRRASEFVHRLAPELRRIDAIETPHCLGDLEIWVPKLDHLTTWQAAYEAAQHGGNELWFYTVGIYQGGGLLNKTVDVPLLETRLMPWLNYRYDLRGYLHWGLNAWTEDPIRAPGLHRGDGWLVYPKSGGLLDSLRWEQTRNGLEDYECLWLLENKTAQIKARLAPRVAALINPRQRGVEIASQVVADYQVHTQNPDVLYQARREAIEETLALEQSPRLLLQSTPLEHSPVGKGCVVDLRGWAEPGTVVTANGQAVPVADDGLFLAALSPAADGRIVVEAQNERGKKQLVRRFAVALSAPVSARE